MRRVCAAGLVFVAVLWLGLVLGVSFLATPVKFRAGSLDLPTALEVGRVTFVVFTRVEWGLFFVLAVLVMLARPGWFFWAGLGVLGAVLLLEGLWLLPVLDVRAGLVMAGEKIPESAHHWLYVAAEGWKAAVLAAMGGVGLGVLSFKN